MADAGWRAIVRPALLYGAEVVDFPKAWITHMESVQNKLGRWILGVHKGASSVGVRGELGWGTMQGCIDKAKANFWLRVRALERGRWPREALEWCLSAPYESVFWRAAYEALERLEIPWGGPERKKGTIKKRAELIERQRWVRAKEADVRLSLSPKVELRGREGYVSRGAIPAIMAAFRIGALERLWEERLQGPCYRCGEGFDEIRQHVLECRELGAGWAWREGEGRVERVRLILADTSWPNMCLVARRWKLWERERPH